MITNERQYKITKAEVKNFEQALASFSADSEVRAGIHPRLIQAERDALESQILDMKDELRQYEQLKSSKNPVISLDSFEELAGGLIKARIASGLTQRELAERLGLKEQQIQRYESDRYASASLKRLQDVANAIGVRVRNDILLPVEAKGIDGLVRKLEQVGVSESFLIERLLPPNDAAHLRGEVGSEDDQTIALKVGNILERIFGWSRSDLFGSQPLSAPRYAAAEARFKIPGGRTRGGITLYAAYANYLSVIVLKGCRQLPNRQISTDPILVRKNIEDRYGEFSLRSALHYSWDLGIPVLPLKYQGSFHGACWRYDGRNVIVLKQASRHEARWIFDLFHEIFHAAQNPDLETLEVIEDDETSSERRNSMEEIAASQFAGNVLLRGRADELANISVTAARNSVERLKGVVPGVAERANVSVGALANYLAFRLSWQGLNWWGAANNLQTEDSDPWSIARDVFIERFPFKFDSELDKQLLDRAIN